MSIVAHCRFIAYNGKLYVMYDIHDTIDHSTKETTNVNGEIALLERG